MPYPVMDERPHFLFSHLRVRINAPFPSDESGVEGVNALQQRSKLRRPGAPALHGHRSLRLFVWIEKKTAVVTIIDAGIIRL